MKVEEAISLIDPRFTELGVNVNRIVAWDCGEDMVRL